MASAPYINTTADGQRHCKNRRDLLRTKIQSTVSTDQAESDDGEDYPTTISEQPDLDSQDPPAVRQSERTTVIPRKYLD